MNDLAASTIHKDLENADYKNWKAFLASCESWSVERTAEYQLTEINRVLGLALQTPGYTDLYAGYGLSGRIRHLDELELYPLITKEQLRENLKQFTLPGDFDYVTTGGSTGIPLGLYRSKAAFAKELASKAHQYHRIGWQEGDRQVVLRGLPISNAEGTQFFPEFNELRLSSYQLVPERMRHYVKIIEAYKPSWLRCYPSSAQIFASFLQDEKLRLPPLQGLLCASENLYRFQIDMFRQVFGGRIFSHYGHYELAVLAGFCQHADTYHVMPQYGLAELIGSKGQKVDQPGEIGEIVGTSFISDGTILCRYRTNDYAVYEGDLCPHCGRHGQIWRNIDGRLQDFIVTSTGRMISMTAINMHDDIFDPLRQFQFEQHEQGRVTFKYISRSDLSDDTVEHIMRRLSPKLGKDIQVIPVAVDDISLTPRGKHRFLIQHMNLEFGDHARQTLFAKG